MLTKTETLYMRAKSPGSYQYPLSTTWASKATQKINEKTEAERSRPGLITITQFKGTETAKGLLCAAACIK